MLSPGEIEDHIRACGRNSRESQKILYISFYSYAMAVCERYSNNNRDAMKMLNDGFLSIFKNIRRFKPAQVNIARSFKGWIREMMLHAAIEYFKKNYSHDKLTGADSLAHHPASENEDPIEELTHEVMIGALRQLSPAYRIVYNLFVIEGWDHDLIAKKLRIAMTDSQLNLLKARKQLKKRLAERNTFSGRMTTSL